MKLSGYLTGQMANPTYGGMLNRTVQGGYQQVYDQMALKKARRAQESALAMLQNADPTDPRVQQSVMDVYRQMNQNPTEAQALIDNAVGKKYQSEEQARAVERQALLKERQVWGRLNHEYQQTKIAEDKAIRGHKGQALRTYMETGDVDAALVGVPDDYKDEVQQAVTRKVSTDYTLDIMQQARKNNAPVKDEVLEKITELYPELKKSVEIYKTDPNAPRANENLQTAIRTAFAASLQATSDRLPTTGELEAALKMIDKADWGPGTFHNISNEIYQPLAREIIRRLRAGESMDNDKIRAIGEKMVEDLAAEGSPGDLPRIRTEADWNKLEKGTEFIWVDEDGTESKGVK